MKKNIVNWFIRKFSSKLLLIDKTYDLPGLWEINHLKKTLMHCKVDCVFDIGANFGQYATMLRNDVGYKGVIISFEPMPEAATRLREIARLDPLWFIEEIALSDENCDKSFNIMKGHQFSSLSQPIHSEVENFVSTNKVAKELRVKSETLSFVYARLEKEHKFKRPFLKMDTQGYDVKVIRSGKEIVHHFVGLQSELAIKRIYKDSVDFRVALTEYEDHGFSLSSFVPNNAGHFPKLIETDCIMIRNDLM